MDIQLNRDSDEGQRHRNDLLFIFALAFVFRVALLLLFPAPYGNDAAGRLYFRDTLWIGHWLPLTQGLVNAAFAMTHSVFSVRLLFALLTGLSATAFAFYLQAFASRRAALIGGILFALNAQLVFLSLMPYQEVLFLGLLFGSLGFFVRAEMAVNNYRDFIPGAILFGLACLTRYEAWFILPALWAAQAWRAARAREKVFFKIAAATMALAWAPMLWLIVNWQIYGNPMAFLFHRADHAFYAWQPHGETVRILNYLGMMGYWLLRFGSPLILFAIPGLTYAWKNRRTLARTLWPAFLLFVMEMIFLIFVAGKEFATANRFAAIPLGILLIFVALGVDEMIERVRQSPNSFWNKIKSRLMPRLLLFAFCFLLFIYGAQPVARANATAEFREPYEIAQFLQKNLRRNERALMIAESIDGAVPMPYQRVFGQLTFDQDQLLCAALLEDEAGRDPLQLLRRRQVRYLIVFGGNWPKGENDRALLNFIASRPNYIMKIFTNTAASVYDCTGAFAGSLSKTAK